MIVPIFLLIGSLAKATFYFIIIIIFYLLIGSLAKAKFCNALEHPITKLARANLWMKNTTYTLEFLLSFIII
jgi:hypothetical protein